MGITAHNIRLTTSPNSEAMLTSPPEPVSLFVSLIQASYFCPTLCLPGPPSPIMPLIRSLFLLGIMVHQTLGSPAWSRAHKAQAASTGKAIYFLTNDAQQNTVIAIPIGADGTLSGGSQTSTGGAGASGIEGSTNKTAGPDALFSQSSLTLAGSVCPTHPT